MDQDRQSIIDTEKFNKVFGSIEKQMLMQSSFLESIYNIQTQQLDMERDRAKREAARLAALSAQGTEETIGAPTTTATGDVDLGAASDKQKESILANIIPGIGNFIGSLFGTMGGMGLAGLGSKVLGAGAIAILAPAVGNFIAEFSKSALEDWSPDTAGFNTGFSDALGAATTWGLIGSIFGKRIGLIFAGLAAGASAGESIFKSLDEDQDGIINAFGMAFTENEFTNIGTAIGGALGLALPGIVSSSLKPVFAAMMTPGVGLVALSAAALLGGVYLIDKWADERRNEFIDGLNNELKKGLDEYKSEEDRSLISKIWTGITGADNDDAIGAQLQELESELQTEKIRQAGPSMEFGDAAPMDLDISRIEDTGLREKIEEARATINSVLSGDNLNNLSLDKLEQLERITAELDLYSQNTRIKARIDAITEAARQLDIEAAANFQATAEAMSSIDPGSGVPSIVTTPPDTSQSPTAAQSNSILESLNRSDNALIEKLNRIESGSSSAPKIIPVPMPMPGQGATAAPSNIDQSTTSNSTTIFAGRSKFDELDTFVIGAR